MKGEAGAAYRRQTVQRQAQASALPKRTLADAPSVSDQISDRMNLPEMTPDGSELDIPKQCAVV
jgi:hypothetical protein